jgi:hypothetical protein
MNCDMPGKCPFCGEHTYCVNAKHFSYPERNQGARFSPRQFNFLPAAKKLALYIKAISKGAVDVHPSKLEIFLEKLLEFDLMEAEEAGVTGAPQSQLANTGEGHPARLVRESIPETVPERLWCSYPDCHCEREHDGVCQAIIIKVEKR